MSKVLKRFAFCCIGMCLAGSVAHADGAIVIEGGMLIDVARPETIGTATLVIDNGRIIAVGAPDDIEIPAEATVIDARNRFVMPGIADMHNHLRTGMFRPGSDKAAILEDLLDWGVTTVMDPGVAEDTFDSLRLTIDEDPDAFPRAFLVRGMFTTEDGWGDGYKPTTEAEAREFVRKLKAAGSDGVKIIYDDMSWVTTRPFAVLDRRIVAAIIDEAHRQHMKAFAHAPLQAPALFHEVPQGTPRLDNTVWAAERLPVLRANLFTVANAGIPMLIGTDTGIPGVLPGVATQLELVMHAEAGLMPAAVLQAATANAARVMDREGEFGTLAVGAQADLLVLDADPRDDVANIRRIRHVIRSGRVVR